MNIKKEGIWVSQGDDKIYVEVS